MRMRDLMALVEAVSPKNRAILNRTKKAFFCGAFDTRDGEVLEVHPYERAERCDFHHSMYFSQQSQIAMEDDEAAFFWIDEKGVQTEWRAPAATHDMLRKILDQITITATQARP